MSLISGSGRFPGAGHDKPLQILAWRAPSTEEPGGLQSVASQRVTHNWSNLAQLVLHKQLISYWLPLQRYSPFLSIAHSSKRKVLPQLQYRMDIWDYIKLDIICMLDAYFGRKAHPTNLRIYILISEECTSAYVYRYRYFWGALNVQLVAFTPPGSLWITWVYVLSISWKQEREKQISQFINSQCIGKLGANWGLLISHLLLFVYVIQSICQIL